ncbi:hypothetical protein [Brevibacillus centrosporus]|uniref:Uncharacterized protein n=1 Tax=Brevibacillus centrosporus TaxID=54910 RepID=A0A1I3ZXP6_9BACL|nr:hypothetical protein [Brevibacillus centrosporus]SFK48309.1 hypothetical protein SAMN05518846_11428 [Brevibacillus centrosporus]
MLEINQWDLVAGIFNGMFLFGKAFVSAMPWYGWVIFGVGALAKYVDKKLKILDRVLTKAFSL